MFEIFVSREKNPDLVSRLIMKKIGADYSHIGIIVHGHTIWHATGSGFGIEPMESFLAKRMIVDRIKVDVRDEAFAMGYLHGMKGREYSTSQYLGFLIPAISKLFRNGQEKTICSEAVMEFMSACAGYPFLSQGADFIDPKQAFELIKEHVEVWG